MISSYVKQTMRFAPGVGLDATPKCVLGASMAAITIIGLPVWAATDNRDAETVNFDTLDVEEIIVRQARSDPFVRVPIGGGSEPLAVAVSEQFANYPGVTLTGQGGLFQGVGVRGFSRQRLHWRLGDIPIRTQRNAGATLSFLPPALAAGIGVLSPFESQAMGSGSLGGSLLASLRNPQSNSILAGYDTVGNRRDLAILGRVGTVGFGIAEQRRQPGEDAAGQDLNSGFTQRAAFARISQAIAPELTLAASVLASHGTDIGKSNTDFPLRTTHYPHDRHVLSQIALQAQRWRGYVYQYRHGLRTEVNDADGVTQLSSGSRDSGAGVEYHVLHGSADHAFYSQWHARRDITTSEFTADGARDALDGNEDQLNVGYDYALSLANSLLTARIVLHHIRQNRQVTENLVTGAAQFSTGGLTAELSRNFRAPRLSERFFSGITGRGSVVSNQDLQSEIADTLSVRYSGGFGAVRFSLEGFASGMQDVIERVRLDPTTTTFDNVNRARIYGVRWSAQYALNDLLRLDISGHTVRARDRAGMALNHQMGSEVIARLMGAVGRHDWSVRYRHRLPHTDVSADDLPLDRAHLVDMQWHFQMNEQFGFALGGYNLLDERYRLASDDKSTLGHGRSFRLTLVLEV